MHPQVSVVIPVYNIEAHLRQCLDSVLGQGLREIEIICVDDGSTDGSPAVLAEYAARDPRLKVVTQANAGPGAARNTGLARAAGEYLIFLDSDDWFEPDFLERMVAQAQKTNADVTICRADEFDNATGNTLDGSWMLKTQYLPGESFAPEEIREHIFQFTYGWPWDKLYRLAFVQRKGLFYPSLPNSEDLVFVFQSLALASRLSVLDQTLIHHRVNRKSSVSNSRHRNPEVPQQALKLLREALMCQQVYEVFERSFLNWAMEFLVWNVANMGEDRAQRLYFDKLKREWLPEMHFERYPAAYYENRFTYCKYLLTQYAPWPVFSGVLRGYHRLKRRKAGEG